MPDNSSSPQQPSQSAVASKHKKPYQKPAFRYERVFETLALACGKVAPTAPGCQFSLNKSS